jgi:hypothetical protein
MSRRLTVQHFSLAINLWLLGDSQSIYQTLPAHEIESPTITRIEEGSPTNFVMELNFTVQQSMKRR